jgi:hypothetical protein
MASKPKSSTPRKESLFKTIFVWGFDLAYLAALVWFFHVPANQALFWNTIGSWATGGVTAYVNWQLEHRTSLAEEKRSHDTRLPVPAKPETSADPENKLPTNSASESQQKSITSNEFPIPDFFQPPPVAFDPQEHEVTKAEPIPDSRPVDESGKRISRLKKGPGKPVRFEKKKIKGVPFYLVTVDLTDPSAFLQIALPKDAPYANCKDVSYGHENFDVTLKRHPCAVALNGTFFSKDQEERVMGNMVSEGKILKYSRWEDYGTTLGLRTDNQPEMITARVEGQPDWSKHWFSVTCGPRLLKQGEVWVNPSQEGFMDSHVLGIGPRSAIGYDKTGEKLFIVNFLRGLSLTEEAKLMKAIGCHEAMNLDGGASKALAYNGKIVMKAGRGLTNVLVIYDSRHAAPPHVVKSWKDFQETGTTSEFIPVTYTQKAHNSPRPQS